MNGEPFFHGKYYEIWELRIKEHIMVIRCHVWYTIVTRYTPLKKVKNETQKEAKKNNLISTEDILDGLSNSIKGKVRQCKSTKELWKN